MKLFILIMFLQIKVLAIVKVAVIDSGFDTKSTWSNSSINKLKVPKLCKDIKPYNTLTKSSNVTDNHGHGTHVAGLIASNTNSNDYCLVIIKFYDPKFNEMDFMKSEIEAIKYAIKSKVDIINLSGGGEEYSKLECTIVKQALDAGIVFVAAAGNEASDIDKVPYYPAACDSRVKIVGNYTKEGTLNKLSNYSTKKYKIIKEIGVNITSIMPNNTYGIMSGTSQATAITTGKLIDRVGKIKKLCEVE